MRQAQLPQRGYEKNGGKGGGLEWFLSMKWRLFHQGRRQPQEGKGVPGNLFLALLIEKGTEGKMTEKEEGVQSFSVRTLTRR